MRSTWLPGTGNPRQSLSLAQTTGGGIMAVWEIIGRNQRAERYLALSRHERALKFEQRRYRLALGLALIFALGNLISGVYYACA